LMSTPVRRGEVITGYLAGFGIFAVIQTIIVVVYAINVLNISIVGSIWNVILINLILAFVALSLGILLSTFASSEFQMIQFIPVVIIPQVFFSGIFPVESMAWWLRAIAKIVPIYYGADALRGVMYKGLSFSEVSTDIFVLVLYAALFITLNIFALKKYRKL
jgi:ABC-2 type transport system permease protein